MRRISQLKLSPDDEEKEKCILQLRAIKENAVSCFSPDVRETTNRIFEEMVCGILFDIHMELRSNVSDPKWYSTPRPGSERMDNELAEMAKNLDITTGNTNVPCPNCSVLVKYPSMTKHLERCGNYTNTSSSYGSRTSSRVARQRIQEGFKNSKDKSKPEDDEDKRNKAKPKKRNYKTKKKPAK